MDGDTIDVDGIRYRINGIDAPEHGQTCNIPSGEWQCGKSATEEMRHLTRGKNVRCEPLTKDGYGRIVATCYSDEVDVGSAMVQSGMAWAYVRFSDFYVFDESVAKAEQLGIWRGEATPAWEYRAERWAVAEQSAPDGCPIKGKISLNGNIYHAPWSPYYNRTRINISKGEKWFCSEAEAVAAGWRAPYRN